MRAGGTSSVPHNKKTHHNAFAITGFGNRARNNRMDSGTLIHTTYHSQEMAGLRIHPFALAVLALHLDLVGHDLGVAHLTLCTGLGALRDQTEEPLDGVDAGIEE